MLLATCVAATAVEIPDTLIVGGETYEDVKYKSHDASRLVVTQEGGGMFDVPIAKLQPALQTKLGYDEKAALAAEAARQAAAQASSVEIERKLDAIVIPSVSLKDTAPRDALEYLRKESWRHDNESSAEHRGVNIVLRLKGSEESANDRPGVTVEMRNVTLREALTRLCSEARLKYRVGPYHVTLVEADMEFPQ